MIGKKKSNIKVDIVENQIHVDSTNEVSKNTLSDSLAINQSQGSSLFINKDSPPLTLSSFSEKNMTDRYYYIYNNIGKENINNDVFKKFYDDFILGGVDESTFAKKACDVILKYFIYKIYFESKSSIIISLENPGEFKDDKIITTLLKNEKLENMVINLLRNRGFNASVIRDSKNNESDAIKVSIK